MPTAVPIQWVLATTPKVPSISGRVVKAPALMLGDDITKAPIAPHRLKSAASVESAMDKFNRRGALPLGRFCITRQRTHAGVQALSPMRQTHAESALQFTTIKA